MRYLLKFYSVFIILFGFHNAAVSQDHIDASKAFDFWIGDWETHWMNPDSSYTYANNLIEKSLDGRVIQEHFVDSSSGFKGTSITVFGAGDSIWHQAWADNAGGYFDFYGIIEGEQRIFQTKPIDQNGIAIVQRMTFNSISDSSFTWNWELTKDSGANWDLTWQIFYERKKPGNELLD